MMVEEYMLSEKAKANIARSNLVKKAMTEEIKRRGWDPKVVQRLKYPRAARTLRDWAKGQWPDLDHDWLDMHAYQTLSEAGFHYHGPTGLA